MMTTDTGKISVSTDTVSLNDCTEAFAVPGKDSLIDLIHPVTGRSVINGHSLAEIRQRYPDAEIVNVEAFLAAKVERQDTPVTWRETTGDRFNDMLNCLPPACYGSGGFLVGEPSDHHATSGQPRYRGFRQVGGRYYESSRPLTRVEFIAQTSKGPQQ